MEYRVRPALGAFGPAPLLGGVGRSVFCAFVFGLPYRTLAGMTTTHLFRGMLILGLCSCGTGDPALPWSELIGSWKLESTNGVPIHRDQESLTRGLRP